MPRAGSLYGILYEAFAALYIHINGLNQIWRCGACDVCEIAHTDEGELEQFGGSSSFCSCWCSVLEAPMADERTSSQKLLSQIGDPKMTKLGALEHVVIASWKPGKGFMQKKFTFAEVRK